MTRARKLAIISAVSLAGFGLVPACGGHQALDVTAPEDDSGGDWGDDEPLPGDKKAGEPKKEEAWDPCFQKKCGTACTVCSPADEECDELQILKQCTSDGDCVVAPVECAAEEDEGKKKKK